MGFLDLFKKDKKKSDKKESKKFKACAWEIDPKHPSNRRSVHFGDQSLNTACYQSIGKKYPKGPRSCPVEEELYDEDWAASAQVTRNKNMRSSESRPNTSSHKVHPSKSDASRYSTFLDASSEDEENTVKWRRNREPALTDEDRMRDSYRQAYYKEKEEREQERRRNDDMVDLLRQKVRELEMNNDALRAERSQMRLSTSMQYVETTQQMMSPFHPSSRQGLLPRTSTPATGRVAPFGAFSPAFSTGPHSLPPFPAPIGPPAGQFPPLSYTPSRAETRGSIRGMATPRQLNFDGAGGITADETFSIRGSPYSAEQSQRSSGYHQPTNMRAAPTGNGAHESLASSPDYAHYDEI